MLHQHYLLSNMCLQRLACFRGYLSESALCRVNSFCALKIFYMEKNTDVMKNISLKWWVHINRRSAPSFVFLRRRHLQDSWCNSPPAGVHGWWSWESILPCLLHNGLDGGEAGPWQTETAEWRCNSRWSTRHILNYCGPWCVSQGCSNLCLHRCIHRSQPRSWEHRLWYPIQYWIKELNENIWENIKSILSTRVTKLAGLDKLTWSTYECCGTASF